MSFLTLANCASCNQS